MKNDLAGTGPAIAVFDIGTNSTKLLIAQDSSPGGTATEIKFLKKTTRIGEGVSSTGEISAAALLRTVNAIEYFLQFVGQYDCKHVLAFSTHALRTAANGRDTAARIEDETGINVRILSGDEEARFAYLSARTRVGPLNPHAYIIDVGGGSIEFLHAARGDIVTTRSLPLGALHLTEQFLKSDPIRKEEIAELRAHVSHAVTRLFQSSPRRNIPASQTDLVASGGSITTIKNMCDQSFASASIKTPKIRIGDARRLETRCLALPLQKRKRMPGIEPDRADILPAGLATVIAFMEAAGKRVLKINPGGVRDGVLIHAVQNNYQW